MVDKEIKRKLRRIWCERLVIGLCFSILSGFLAVKMLSVLNLSAQLQVKEQELQIENKEFRVETQKLLKNYDELLGSKKALLFKGQKLESLEQALKYVDNKSYKVEVVVGGRLFKFYKNSLLPSEKERLDNKLSQEVQFLGLSFLGFLVLMILLLRQRNRISLSLLGQLICFFSEECIAELEALRQQLKAEHYSTFHIQMIVLWNFLELLYVFYIQINIENLWLPQHKGRKNGDE